ncbi:MAG: hypothetical protein ABIC95_06550 [archaeon]
MGKIKQMLKSVRVILLLVFLVLAVIAIRPGFGDDQVAIRSVLTNSSASDAGILNPNPRAPPMSRERIETVNGKMISDVAAFYEAVDAVPIGQAFTVTTDQSLYRLEVRPLTRTIILDEMENFTFTEVVAENVTINGTVTTVNNTYNRTGERHKTTSEVIGREDIGLKVYPAPINNIRKGLDLTGGTRVLLQPDVEVSAEDLDIVLSNLKERLNVYGLSDIVVRPSKDLEGQQFILVEIAGANEEEVQDLLGSQGKFEAKIGNVTVFRGGDDVTYVARSAGQAGIDPVAGCGLAGDGSHVCRFRFAITLSPEAAERQADASRDLAIVASESGEEYLSEQLVLFLDDERVDELNIGADLRGRAVTDISISGAGAGASRDEAVFNALANMKRLQTILVTGSLPVKLDIVQSNAISPALGEEFIDNALLVGILAMIGVALVVFIRYRTIKIIIPMIITMGSEVILLLGLASLIGWNLDLAAVAGILIAVGTGVDDQIIITDETIGKKHGKTPLTWKQRIQRAFFIIMAAYFTTVVAMAPLWFAGAGLLKGFAITTIFGVTFGVFVTRPAFAAMIEVLSKE